MFAVLSGVAGDVNKLALLEAIVSGAWLFVCVVGSD
jgi:hypothetical protein